MRATLACVSSLALHGGWCAAGARADAWLDAGARAQAGYPASTTTRDAGSLTLDPGSLTLDPGSLTLDAGSPMRDAGSPLRDAGSPAPAESVRRESTDAGAAFAPADATRVTSAQLAVLEPVIEVSVRARSRADALRRSAYAVSVVELAEARQRASDLGEVLARDTAVTVQRAGGLGSQGAFNLGGLGGQRLRFFLDGVPLELMGFAAGVQNVPVNLIERVELYQGVVPGRLGSDALGGAVQLVSEESVRQSGASASYQLGDFGTHRATASGRYVHAPTGLTARASVFFDRADNDYDVDVSAFDAQGRTQPARLRRFHDGYGANGFHVGAGVIGKPWAERLMVSGFRSAFDNDVQSGATMARPFGEVTFARQTFGLNARYVLERAARGLRLEVTAGYARLSAQFRDLSTCLYDWYGRCAPRPVQGEITAGVPQSTDLQTDTVYLRAEHAQRISELLRMRIALAPTYAERSGESRLLGTGPDPLAPARRLFTGVAAVELETSLLDGQLKNIAFAKGYALATASRALRATGAWEDLSQTRFRAGGGDSLRVHLAEPLYAKASYEYALRQPSTDELFGDGLLVRDSLDLLPERSHNANLTVELDAWRSALGVVRATLAGFARWSSDLIASLSDGADYVRNVNLSRARAVGLEAALHWETPGVPWLALDGRLTHQDLRSRESATGPLAATRGDRVPNIPYLLANGSVRLRGEDLLLPEDVAELSWHVRYVHAFHRGWESLAAGASERLIIPRQISHSAALTYRHAGKLSTTLEAHNVTDARLYDFYGVQRPGRAFYAKWTLEY